MSSEWVLLAYRIPREPSTPRISVWRKLRRLGAVQLLDGLVALPHDARTKEHLEWIAEEVTAAGGEANLWIGQPATKAQQRALTAQVTTEAELAYQAIADEAATADAGKRTLARLRRDLKRVRQRDYFPGDGYERAVAAIEALAAKLGEPVPR